MEISFKEVFEGVRGFFDRLMVVAIVLLLLALLWSPSYVPAAESLSDQAGNAWILWRGNIFLISTIIIIVGIALHFVYIVGKNTVGNVRMMEERTERVLLPGPHIVIPFLMEVEETPSIAKELHVDVSGIEVSKKAWQFFANAIFSYQLVPKNSWNLLDKLTYSDAGEMIKKKIAEAAKSVYRGIDLDSFWGNPLEQKLYETRLLAEVIIGVQELMRINTGEADIFTMGFISIEYSAPGYQAAIEKRNAAEIRQQELEFEGEAQKNLSKKLTEAKAYEALQLGLNNAQVQKAFGEVLRDHPGLTVFEAVQPLPQYLSLGTGSSFDLMGFMAAFNMMYGGKMPSSSSTVTPPYTGPSGSLPKP